MNAIPRSKDSTFACIRVHCLVELIPVPSMKVINGLIGIELGVQVTFIESFIDVDLCHAGKIISI
ncbi:hypothetical protein CJO78_11525 [Ralstonia solanacearum]|nr:hypothetical protein CJO78_11525 [Ralstonia solanacearum]AXW24118.1 hypothetical protein CJO86_11305 [Ralstonia solanacearum]AXW81052.1 hypothetical protein CJO98_11535 [Ralstonia solanacearum]